MKKQNLLCCILCSYVVVWLGVPVSVRAALSVNSPTFPSNNTVRVTLNGAESTNAHIIFWTPALLTNLNDWTRLTTGSVGQVTFDLTRPTNANSFYRASTEPNLTPTVATPVLSPGGGSYPHATNVTITYGTAGAAIYYTTNGSTPSALDNYIYSGGSVFLDRTTTLKAKAFKFSYNDSATASATYTINHAPDVIAGEQQIIGSSPATLAGVVTDDGLTGGGTRLTNWSKVSGPGTVTFGNAGVTNTTASLSADGIYVLKLSASDGQYTNLSLVTVALNPTLSVSIVEPLDDSSYTVPTNFLLRASAASTSGSVTQVWFYTGSTLIGAATSPGGSEFTYEWLSVPAGNHQLRAVAWSDDAANVSLASDAVDIAVNWPTNVGQVTLVLTDLLIPVAGLPITVNRLYDTRRGSAGTFGENWRLDYEDIRIEKSAGLSSGYTALFSSGQDCIVPGHDTLVTVTLGEGEKYYFRPRVVFQAGGGSTCIGHSTVNFLAPVRFVFDSLGFGELASINAPEDVGMVGDDYYQSGVWSGVIYPGYYDFDGEPLGAYEPDFSQFTFTAPDGMRYGFNGDGTLYSRTDRNNNTLYYGNSSIAHSSGKQVTFTRDGNNRITEIYDPIAQELGATVPAIKYDYDSNGNLTNVARLVQRDPAVYENIAYAYTNASYPHHITSVTDARPVVSARYEYDSSGRLFKQYDALNRYTAYSYDLANHRQIVTDKLFGTTIQNFTLAGQLESVQDAENAVTSYSYDERGRRVSETDPLNQETTYAYDANDQLTGVTNELNQSSSATYNEFGQVLVSIDARNNGTTNEYDAAGNLLFVTNALRVVSAYSYDSQGNRVAETNALGRPEQVIVLNTYNEFGWLTNTATLNAQLTTLNQIGYTYDGNGNRKTEIKTRTVSGGQQTLTTTWTYDAANRVTQTIDPANGTNRVVFNAINKQSQTFDALNRTNRYFYDAIGLLTNTTYADGLSEKFAYDAEGHRTRSEDRGGRATTFTYNGLGRLTRTTYPDTGYARNVYDAVGRLTSTVQGQAQPGDPPAPSQELNTFYFYDAAGRRTAITNHLNEGTRFGYDANGNQIAVIDALGRTNRYEYDALNRQNTLTYPDNTAESYGYDGLHRRIAVTNQAGIITRFGYDALDRLAAVTNAFGTSQAMVTKYVYDEVGNLLQQVDSLNRTNRFEYDSLGRRTKEVMPGNQSASFGYDAVGNMIRHTNFNTVILTNSYDTLNRLTNRSSAGGNKITFAYSPTSQRAQMVDASGTNTYTYDDRDRLLTKATPQGTLTYTYNTFGNLSRIESSTANGAKLSYRYDVLNRLTNALDRFTNNTFYAFDAVGNLQTARLPNLVTNSWTYNSLNRLTNISVKTAGGTIATFSYKLGAAGNRTNLIENINGTARTNVWTYDALYRLTNETITGSTPTGTVSYKYDAVGNRTNRTSTVTGVSTTNSAYSANDQLTSDNYDSNGNTTNSAATPYRYDAENRLTNFNNGTATYIYDGDGNRVRKIAGGVTNYYLVDDRNPTGYAQVLEEATSVGGPPLLYSYGLDLISQRQTNGTTSFYGYDGNGNVRYLTAANATVSDTYAYDAFGILITSTGGTPNNYRYSGEQFDSNLGFYYLRARYVNPTTGRFWTRDSFEGIREEPRSLHRYLYAFANPINITDPSGRDALSSAINGQKVHKRIGEHFKASRSGRIYGPSISTILGISLPIIALFPDLIDTQTKEIYEIKPLLSFPEGVLQLAGYIEVFNQFDSAKGWRAGSEFSYSPPSRIDLGYGAWAIVFPPKSGVILYDVTDLPSLSLVAVGAIVTVIQLDLQITFGVAILNSVLGAP